jgi:hypothetical protein
MGKQASGKRSCSALTPDQMNRDCAVPNATEREKRVYAIRKLICSRPPRAPSGRQFDQSGHARDTGNGQNLVHPHRCNR